jgi:hypothetical protein
MVEPVIVLATSVAIVVVPDRTALELNTFDPVPVNEVVPVPPCATARVPVMLEALRDVMPAPEPVIVVAVRDCTLVVAVPIVVVPGLILMKLLVLLAPIKTDVFEFVLYIAKSLILVPANTGLLVETSFIKL